MAKRGRKPKRRFNFTGNKSIINSAFSLMFILVGGVSGFAFFSYWLGGNSDFSSKLGGFLSDTFGISSIFISLISIYLGFKVMGLKWRMLKTRILLGLMLMFVTFTGLTSSASGVVGLELRSFTASVISNLGAWFFFFILFLFSIVLITNTSIAPFFEKTGDFLLAFTKKTFPLLKKFLPVNDKFEELKPLDNQKPLEILDSNEGSDVGDGFKISGALEAQELEVTEVSKEDHSVSDYISPSLSDNSESSRKIAEEAGFSAGDIINEKRLVDANFKILNSPVAPISESELISDDSDDSSLVDLDDVDALSPKVTESSVVSESDVAKEQIELAMKEANISKKPEGLPFSNKVWDYPSLNLLKDTPNRGADAGDVQGRAHAIEDTLRSFGIKAKIADVRVGPAVTQYALTVSMGTKTSKVQSVSADLALRIKSPSGSVRIEAPIPGTDLIGIEVPNNTPSLVTLKSVLSSPEFKNNKGKLKIALGHTVSGKPLVYDIAKMPHVLIAGSTGSGKSIMLNAIISSLLFNNSPQECKLIMIDPKYVEFVQYNDIPHLLTPVITDVEQKAVSALAWAVSEMERRYKLFASAGVRNIEGYNSKSGFQAEPYIVIVIDELADMMMVASNDVEKYITRIAQKARAVGIHLVVATQRPSVNILTGMIKANIPTRISFKVASNTDSRVILDQVGAEVLIGRGDMLFVPPTDSKPRRIQGVFVDDKEIETLVNYLKEQGSGPSYNNDIVSQQISNSKDGKMTVGASSDDKFKEALEIICADGKASASHLQRRLSIGYTRAARMIDDMEEMGVIGQARGSKPRDVLITSPEDVLGNDDV